MSQRYARLGIDKLGVGTYGYVYPAWDSEERRLVAVKVQKKKSEEAAREMMFFQSIPSHAHLITMLDAYVEEPNLLLVFEYLYNSLSDVFHRAHGLLPMDVSRHYAYQILMGLRHLACPQRGTPRSILGEHLGGHAQQLSQNC